MTTPRSREAPSHRVHGAWVPGGGLHLWVGSAEREPGAVPVAVAEPGAIPAGILPPAAELALRGRDRFRHGLRIRRPGDRPVEVPSVAFAPADAARLLLEIAGSRRGAALAPDLGALVAMAVGIERWAASGRVVPALVHEDGRWWPRLRLSAGPEVASWARESAVRAPLALAHAGGRDWAGDLLRTLTPIIALEVLDPPAGLHPMLEALRLGEPWAGGSQGIADALDRWRDGGRVAGSALSLRLVEPAEDGGAEGWVILPCLRDSGAVRPLLELGVDALLAAGAWDERVTGAWPPLAEAARDPVGGGFVLDVAGVIEFVDRGAAALIAAGIGVQLPRAWTVATPTLALRVRPADPEPDAGESTTVVGLADLVEFEWTLALGGVELTAEEVRHLVEGASELVRLRGKWVRADAATLRRAAEYIRARSGAGPRPLAAALAELAVGDPPPVGLDRVDAGDRLAWLTGGAGDAGRAGDEELVPPAWFAAALRPYQLRGFRWLVDRSSRGVGVVLADDMGLGKTIQVLAMLAHEIDTGVSRGPTLLVCPTSVIGNWGKEARRFAPRVRVLVHHGPDRAGTGSFARVAADADLVVTSYPLLARDLAVLSEVPWGRVVLDEAQHVKNRRTAQSRAARSIPAPHRIALTGTPVENRLEELHTIVDFVNPGVLGGPEVFRHRVSTPVAKGEDPTVLPRLRAAIAPFVLRRVKTDPGVVADLPEKQESVVAVALTPEQAALYRAEVDAILADVAAGEGMSKKGRVLAGLTRLKQICNHPAHFLGDGSPVTRRGRHRSGKLAFVDDVVDTVIAEGGRMLLFTQYREFGDMVAAHLAVRLGEPIPFLHGGVRREERDRMIERFQDPPASSPVMVLSLRAGGTGITLTAANHVVHLDRWWNPAVEDQATDRAYRIGQTRDVQVHKLVCAGTLEERIQTMLDDKRRIADLAVYRGEEWITELDPSALRELLRLDPTTVGEPG